MPVTGPDGHGPPGVVRSQTPFAGSSGWPDPLGGVVRTVTKHITAAILVVAAVLYVPFVFLGFGTDPDSYRVVRTAERLTQEGVYSLSRRPGFFVHEIGSTLLIRLGGSAAANLGTLLLAIVCIYAFIEICLHHAIPRPHLLALILLCQPRYWASATSTIDYVWALAPAMLGYLASLRGKELLAGVLLGVAVGARLSSGVFALAVIGSWLPSSRAPAKDLLRQALRLAAPMALVATLMLLPHIVTSGYTLRFLSYVKPEWGWAERLGAFGYRNIYFWGLQTVAVLLALSPWTIRSVRTALLGEHREVVAFGLIIVIMFEALLLLAPLEEEYLLPILPACLMLLGVSLKGRSWALWSILAASASSNVVTVNLIRGSLDKHQIAASLGIWVEPGHLLRQIARRVEIQQWVASGATLREVIDRLEHVSR